MKIACLQFAPNVGDLEGNIARANAVLAEQSLDGLDLLVLPELALTGIHCISATSLRALLSPSQATTSPTWKRSNLISSQRLQVLPRNGHSLRHVV